jgi:hypothetical protein
LAVAVYFASAAEFGAPLWKSAVIAAVIAYAIFVHLGRAMIIWLAPFLMLMTLAHWSDNLPTASQIADVFQRVLSYRPG